ncbi:Na+/H+ antiporter NhaA [Arcticibacterium luteifluviistationis]|uniref:Na(+)/H(+) antiporter NhaA n=1 Tax=Arcticibacterium luteifluviistationis TaxID=1784714 RepID=A0A2Z4G6Q8_9BACT|nr:Na+/H+ antiporter NhaA [Arcticibacterium luteifluviistationis]AWV96800.1 Na+/H+ antiporter NhaA [Arcticibacterium luteifluviistationis]
MIKKQTKEIASIVLSPFERFLKRQSSAGILLLIAAIVAMIWSNSSYAAMYFDIWEYEFTLGIGSFRVSESLLHWVNDGLMAIFFFVVGLEIKREVMAGELSTIKDVVMPLTAAIGGMLVPAIIFLLVVGNSEMAKGWGIPMATDIAFSLGILSLLGPKVPIGLKVFLTALAIVDDIGAILIIAFFYSSDIQWVYLQAAAGFFVLLLVFNYFDLRMLSLYIFVGFFAWFCFLKSGVHPTVAGVLVALTIPARRKIRMDDFIEETKSSLTKFENAEWPDSNVVLGKKQISAVDRIAKSAKKVQSPVQSLENSLSDFTANLVMPIFALANASIVIVGNEFNLLDKVTLATGLGLLVGKVLGVSLFSWLSVRFGWAKLPKGVNWIQIVGVGFLAGIGFTMSLFITNLAYTDAGVINASKIGIVVGSIVAGAIGFVILKINFRKRPI